MGESTLKDKKYPVRFLEDLRELYSEGHLVDTTLTLAECGTLFYAHRCVLVAASPYFRNLMDREQLSEDITIKSITAESFQHLLDFFYTGELTLSSESVSGVLSAAKLMLVEEAISLCQEYMANVTPTQEVNDVETIDGGDISDDEVGKRQKYIKVKGKLSTEATVPRLDVAEVKLEPQGKEQNTEGESSETTRRRTRGRPRMKETPKIKDTGSNLLGSKRRGRKPKRYQEEETTFNPPKVPPEIKVKLYRLIKPKTKAMSKKKEKAERLKRGHRPRVVDENEMDDDKDEDYVPDVSIPTTGRKRGRPKKGEESSPRKKVKAENSNEKTPSKKGRKSKKEAKASDVWEDDSIALNAVLPRVQCPLCAYRFYHKAALQLHLRKHKILMGKNHILKCSKAKERLCIFQFFIRDNNSKQYVCQVCKSSYTLQGKCMAHVTKVHLKKMRCKRCKMKLSNKRTKLLHRCEKKTNTNAVVRPCGFCSRVFKSERVLNKHKNEMHPGKELNLPWECRHCQKTYQQKARFIIHLVGHGLNDKEVDLEFSDPSRVPVRRSLKNIKKDKTNPLPYKCPNCVHRYKTLQDLNVHMINRHNLRVLPPYKQQVKKVRCEEDSCDKVFSRMKDLRSHLTEHHSEASYDCYLCKYKTPIKRLLRLHLKYKHTGLDDRTCSTCNKTFRKRYHYKIHMVSKHGKEDPEVKVFRCDVEGCDYKTYARYVLDIHMRKHDKEKPYSCNICGRKLKSQKAVDKHVSKVHMGIRPFICDICGASYGEEHELKMHIVRHSDVKQFQCEHCEYATHDKGNFQNHLYTKHGILEGRFAKNRGLCSICGFVTAEPSKLEDHMNLHRGLRAHKCPMCQESFYTKARLREHKDWKHNKTTYKCEYCPFSGPTKFYVKEHTRVVHTHRDIKPYKCAYCDFRCRVSGNCRRHIESRHKGMEVKWVKVCEKYPENYKQDKIAVPNKPKVGKKKVSLSSNVMTSKPEHFGAVNTGCCDRFSAKKCFTYDVTQSEDMQTCVGYCDTRIKDNRLNINQPPYLKFPHVNFGKPPQLGSYSQSVQKETFTQHLQNQLQEQPMIQEKNWENYGKYNDHPSSSRNHVTVYDTGVEMKIHQENSSSCDTNIKMQTEKYPTNVPSLKTGASDIGAQEDTCHFEAQHPFYFSPGK